MKSWNPPTAEQLQKVAVLAARSEGRAYFFDRLENPEWVAALFEGGFFASPPDPAPGGETGYVHFPPWPEGRYLVRMAPLSPTSVAKALIQLGQRGNPAVTRHLLEAASALPDDHLPPLAANVIQWVGAPYPEDFADEAVQASRRLLQMGELDRGVEAAAVFLEVQSDPRLAEKAASGDSPLRAQPEAAGRVTDWEYERALGSLVEPLVDHAGMAGLGLISNLLDNALRLSRWDGEGEEHSYDYIWRPAIEDHAQNSDTGIASLLISALRDAAARHASRGGLALEEAIYELESGSVLHRRIALHTLALADAGSPLVTARVGDRRLFDDQRLKHEYATLLRRRFADAEPTAQQAVLRWIEEGPDLADYRERHIQFGGEAPSDEAVENYQLSWQRDWYSFIADHLEGTLAARYRALVTELGDAEHPDFLSWSSSWMGPESPLNRDELLNHGIDEAIEYLRSWRPEDESARHFGPSMEGLGRLFSEVVKERAAEFAAAATRLTDLDPTYIRSFFSGLETTLREGGLFDWGPPIALAAFAVAQPFESDEEVPDRDRDPGWRWCRREVGSLLRSGFADRENRIPFHLREDAWRIVDRLSNDPNPSPNHEHRYGGDNMDPFTLSLNTNRATALHAVVEYALWTRRELEAAGLDISAGFDAMPEVRGALEAHLDPVIDPSLAVRAVYGRWLPWLLLLDESWVVAQLDVLLPSDPELVALREAVWSTFISWCPPYASVFVALRPEYEAAVRRTPSRVAAGSSRRRSVDAKLGEHLVTLFWRGAVDERLLDEFFERAGDELAGEVMEFVGRALHNTEGEVSEGVRTRIQELWDRRLVVAEADPDAHRIETRAFGMSFASGKLDREWALNRLERAVGVAGAPRLGHRVAERLVDTVASDPAAATRILATMLMHPENRWDYVGWRDEARAIVSRVADSADPAVVESCSAIADFYVRHGELDFRELIGRGSPGDR